jgi:hypothetical protein
MCRFLQHQFGKGIFPYVAKLNLNYFRRLNFDVGKSNETTDCAFTLHEQKTNIDF